MVPPKSKGRKRRFGHDAGPSERAKEAHKKRLRSQSLGAHPHATLNARPEVPSINIKHRSYYEIVENQNKKKKLEVKETNHRTPPPGFEFVPIGNPDLTTACKEISREQDAMVFIVTGGIETNALSQQIHRVGHHIRQTIVEQARQEIIDSDESEDDRPPPGVPEPIPATQREINEQADKAIRDLFPRIPHTDRRIIIEHSFKKGVTKKGEPLVGLASAIPLSRRVQLAVLAHIRHTHTRYDKLLKETSYVNARRTVEKLCLDTLVKWRGDEETGRDQLDEILREVIVISDSEGDGEDDDPETDSSGVESGDLGEVFYRPRRHLATVHTRRGEALYHEENRDPYLPWQDVDVPTPSHPTASVYTQEARAKPSRRGFKRYQDALSTRWDEARLRVRLQEDHRDSPANPATGLQTHARHGLTYEEYRPSPPVNDDDLQIIPDPRLANGNNIHLMEQPPRMPMRVAAQVHEAHRGMPEGTQGANSPYIDLRHRTQPQRLLVRSNEARDFLVPSVEPTSPSVAQRVSSSGPIFVRTPKKRSYANDRKLLTESRIFMHGQCPTNNDFRCTMVVTTQEPSSRPQIHPSAGTAAEFRSYDGAVAEPAVTADTNSWTRVPFAANLVARQVPEFYGHPSTESWEMRAEPRPEPHQPHVIEGHHEPMVEYNHPLPGQVQYQRLQERLPPSPVHRVEYGELHNHQSPSVNAPNNWPVHTRQDHIYPATHRPHSQLYQAQLEPAPIFVRRVERHDQPLHLANGHEQPRRQYDDLVMRDADASPRHAGDPWRRPVYAHAQERIHVQPQSERVGAYHPYAGADHAQPPPDNGEYREDYAEQQGGAHRYYQRGP
ncbi:hypothetical protein F503_01522 [Ophiostoma piceae UAMH 11346]|uniref:DUF2293 domain-containing protein n=1 Tax=Ophiostoma piceae (strain UAMH 11346) TaxID=1262450 RepID=S3BUS9_OPHP1|nr:hypothetical protein F503_01522 [Ophiostoma piceae UAMH 11346]